VWEPTPEREREGSLPDTGRSQVLGHHLAPNVAGRDPDVVHVDRYKTPMTGCKLVDVGLVWLVALPLGLRRRRELPFQREELGG